MSSKWCEVFEVIDATNNLRFSYYGKIVYGGSGNRLISYICIDWHLEGKCSPTTEDTCCVLPNQNMSWCDVWVIYVDPDDLKTKKVTMGPIYGAALSCYPYSFNQNFATKVIFKFYVTGKFQGSCPSMYEECGALKQAITCHIDVPSTYREIIFTRSGNQWTTTSNCAERNPCSTCAP